MQRGVKSSIRLPGKRNDRSEGMAATPSNSSRPQSAKLKLVRLARAVPRSRRDASCEPSKHSSCKLGREAPSNSTLEEAKKKIYRGEDESKEECNNVSIRRDLREKERPELEQSVMVVNSGG